MCWNYNQEEGFKPINYKRWGSEFDKNWGGGEWLESRLGRRGIIEGLNTDDDDFTEDTDIDSSSNGSNGDDTEVGFGSSVVGGSSDPSLKRRQKGSKNRLRKLMRKDLKIPTGRSVVSVKGVS